jgi:hypothetical protein
MIRVGSRSCIGVAVPNVRTPDPREARGDRRSGHLSERRFVNPGGNTSFRE